MSPLLPFFFFVQTGLLAVAVSCCIGCSRDGDSSSRKAAGERRRSRPATFTEAEKKAVVEGANKFALALFNRVGIAGENKALSPFSISTALTMISAGARGETLDQMAKVLSFAKYKDKVHDVRASISDTLEDHTKAGDVELVTANAIWPQTDLAIQPQFLSMTKDSYQTELREVDFASNPEVARSEINT